MELIQNYLFWLVGGSILVLAEFLIPGLVVIFLGLGGLLTAGVLYKKWITDPLQLVFFFTLSSIFMLVTLRRLAKKLYPSETEKVETDEDLLVIGRSAETISTVTAHDFSGRIRFAGTTWSARSVQGDIAENMAVTIVGRDNINYLVKVQE